MIEEYKENITNLKNKLNALDPSSDDLDYLFELQVEIMKSIFEQEDKIKATKQQIKELKYFLRKARLNKDDSKKIKDKIDELKAEIKNCKKIAYIYRCIGDGIVFKFISKWNLKRFLYEVDSPEVKSDAGSLSNKDGLKNELALVHNAIENDVPAILTDLTNVIRHGDVCLLGGAAPYVIEVKSSQNKNKRVERQLKAINQIHDYLSNDVADIGGVESMRRVELNHEEIHYNHILNELVVNSGSQSPLKVSPEKGLYYIAIDTTLDTETDYEELFLGIEKPIPFMLNTAKNDEAWGNYYPFTLSIKSSKSLYKFINGDVFIIVIIDFAVIEMEVQKLGLDVEPVFDGAIALALSKKVDGFDEPFRFLVSEHYFGRLAYEFLSLEWFFKELIPNVKTIEEELLSQIA
ncbi:TPA: hypothetical protein I7158_21315 [Vibrio vulnificus]|nr:hypothetical protein [Vibrio vulnificus]HAU8262164.1 hypothetical protein [Vibrio vulnificus]